VLGGILGLIAAGIAGREIMSTASSVTAGPSGFDLGDVSDPQD
jgi:hypothetical protein